MNFRGFFVLQFYLEIARHLLLLKFQRSYLKNQWVTNSK